RGGGRTGRRAVPADEREPAGAEAGPLGDRAEGTTRLPARRAGGVRAAVGHGLRCHAAGYAGGGAAAVHAGGGAALLVVEEGHAGPRPAAGAGGVVAEARGDVAARPGRRRRPVTAEVRRRADAGG